MPSCKTVRRFEQANVAAIQTLSAPNDESDSAGNSPAENAGNEMSPICVLHPPDCRAPLGRAVLPNLTFCLQRSRMHPSTRMPDQALSDKARASWWPPFSFNLVQSRFPLESDTFYELSMLRFRFQIGFFHFSNTNQDNLIQNVNFYDLLTFSASSRDRICRARDHTRIKTI